MSNTVLTKEEIETLTSFQQEQNNLINQLGQVEYQLGFFDRQKTLIITELEAFEKKTTRTGTKTRRKIWSRYCKSRKWWVY